MWIAVRKIWIPFVFRALGLPASAFADQRRLRPSHMRSSLPPPATLAP
jgi:hypothetical protein